MFQVIKSSPVILLHIAVALFGFTAIIGKLSGLETFSLIWWRMSITLSLYLVYFKWINFDYSITRKSLLQCLLIGVFISLHWIGFYGSVKLSHVSVTLLCLTLSLFFVVFLEPLILKNKFSQIDLVFSLCMLPLMYWLIGGVKNFSLSGFILGVFSAFFGAIFSVLNKSMLSTTKPEVLTFYELIGVWIFMTPLFLYSLFSSPMQITIPSNFYEMMLLLALSLLCTNFAYLLCVRSIQKIPIFQANLIIALEPVYGIILALLFLNERQYLSTKFFIGSCLIFGLILLHARIKQTKVALDQ